MIGSGGVERDVALKMLHYELKADSRSVKRLRDEGRMLSALNHPSILCIHDLAVLAERVALVTEYVPGEDLSRCLDQMPLSVALEVLARVADGLCAAWKARSTNGEPLWLIHRDIKPSNIRIGQHGQIKVLDFGIAKARNVQREANTAADSIVGSFVYMAPERFDTRGDTPASDIFSIGCILYEVLAGQRIAAGKTAKDLFLLAMSSENHRAHIAELLEHLTGVAPPLMDLLRQMLAYEEADRPTIDGLAQQLDDLAEGGISLRRWAKGRDWPPDERIEGELAGRLMSERSLTFRTGTLESTKRQDPGLGTMFAVGITSALTALIVVGVVAMLWVNSKGAIGVAQFTGDHTAIVLVDAAGKDHKPGHLEAGIYRIMATFSETQILAGQVEVVAGELVTVTCLSSSQTCSTDPAPPTSGQTPPGTP